MFTTIPKSSNIPKNELKFRDLPVTLRAIDIPANDKGKEIISSRVVGAGMIEIEHPIPDEALLASQLTGKMESNTILIPAQDQKARTGLSQ